MVVSRAVINTLISVAASTTTALTYQRFVTSSGRLRKNWSFMNALNGSYVGMVLNIVRSFSMNPASFHYGTCFSFKNEFVLKIVVAAGCDQYPPWGSLVMGILSYFVYLVFLKLLIKMKSILILIDLTDKVI